MKIQKSALGLVHRGRVRRRRLAPHIIVTRNRNVRCLRTGSVVDAHDWVRARVLGQIELVLLLERGRHEPPAQVVVLAVEVLGAKLGRSQRD